MFYAATEEQIKDKYPDLITMEPGKMRIYYKHNDEPMRLVDRCHGYYFSDKPWGLEDEKWVEGLDQEFVYNNKIMKGKPMNEEQQYLSLNIRNTIKAPDGWTFVSCDYSAEELRLGALNTKSKVFMKAFKDGIDVHLQTATMMFGEEAVHNNKKKLRSIAKGANFGLQYGGSWAVMKTDDNTKEEAMQQYDAYMLAMADHFAVQNAQVRKTKDTLSEFSFFGLPVRLHNYYKSSNNAQYSQGERLAKNHRIQATGADVLSIAFMRLWNNVFNKIDHAEDYIRFQITVHDEIDFLVKNEVIDILMPEVIKNMQVQMPDWEIPLTVGLSFGPTFGQQYEWAYDPNTFKILGPKLEDAPKPKKEEQVEVTPVVEDKPKEEEITIEF